MTNGTGSNRRNGSTLEGVALLAGVSRATVSRVVNGSPKVSPEVRREVEAAIERLGYVPNRAARSLVTRRSGSFGLVITEPTGRLFSDPFFPRLLRGVSAELTARDLQLVLLIPNSKADLSRTGDYLSAGHVDGAVLVSLHGEDPLPARLSAAGIPMVLVGRPTARHLGELRRRRQPAGRADRGRAPHRHGPAGRGNHHRTAGHARGHRPAGRLPRRHRRGLRGDRCQPRGNWRLHPGERLQGDDQAARQATRTSTPCSPHPT